MRIGIQTWGSDGDINPFIALAGGLAGAGHEVTLALTSAERKSYGPYGEKLGFRLLEVGHIGSSDEDVLEFTRLLGETANPFRQTAIIFERMFEPCVDRMYDAARELCSENDLVIGHFILHPLHAAAEKARRPYVTVTLNPSALRSAHVAPTGLPDFGRWINRISWKVILKFVGRIVLPGVNRLRRREGLKEAAGLREVWESPLCNLIAVSRVFCRRQTDWGANQRVCGFFGIPDRARPWRMPEDLRLFLESGPPPVFMTFGSLMSANRLESYINDATRLMVEAARKAGCRAVVQSRWEELKSFSETPGVYRASGFVPHTHLFPHCSAVVHHGGAGTTQSALLAGLPSVVVCQISDQYFWGKELRRLGAAPAPLEGRRATPEKLAKAIRRAVDTPSIGRCARRLGGEMRAEDGVREAVRIIEELTFVSGGIFRSARGPQSPK